MRKLFATIATCGLLLAACAQNSPTQSAPTVSGGGLNCDKASLPLRTAGTLTVATASPAYAPWFRHNDPSNGQGYESAVAYAVAAKLGFSANELKWTAEPFGKSFAPGPKDFDFALEQISITPERAQAVDFSHGYYEDQQALLAVKGTPIANTMAVAKLKPYKFGAEQGTTSLQFISQVIAPDQAPAVYDTTLDARSALEAGQIDGMVLDLPTAAYTQYVVHDGVLVGKFAPTSPPEQFGLLFEKGSGLVPCVNQAVDALKSDGTLAQLQKRWLHGYLDVPQLK